MQTQDAQVLQYFIEEEGFRSKIYPCPKGYPTIGIGKNLKTNPLTSGECEFVGATNDELINGLKQITREQAEILFWNDIGRCTRDLMKYDFWRRPDLTFARSLAILSVRFQLGQTEFLKFKPTIEHLEKGQYEEAAKHLLACQAHADTPNRYERIARMLTTGLWHDAYHP
jgi:lysozyme